MMLTTKPGADHVLVQWRAGIVVVWLHLGALGPRAYGWKTAALCTAPYRLVDNAHSILDTTDLVFIDPVLTGYSRASSARRQRVSHFKKDIESVGDFIRLYATRYQRWLSPKFLIGESYGTTRAAGLSGYLQDRHGMYLNGLMLVSSILDFSTATFIRQRSAAHPLSAHLRGHGWYHRRLEAALQKDCAPAGRSGSVCAGRIRHRAAEGRRADGRRTRAIIQRLARYTVCADYLDRVNLRIEIMRFTKELLRDQRRTVGRLDSRFTGIDRDAGGEMFEYDPGMANTSGPYTAAFNDYVRRELHFESDLPTKC